MCRCIVILVFRITISSASVAPAPPDGALRHVAFLADTIGARPWGSVNEGRAAGYIAGEFRALDLDTRIQGFRPITSDARISQNVIATLPGEPGYGTIYIGAHYDSVASSPGANDNASGVAVLLETARFFATQNISPTLTFVAFGSEEIGLLGSKHVVSQLTAAERLTAEAMINLDCVGYGDTLAVRPAGAHSTDLQQLVTAQATQLGLAALTPDRGSGSSDHESFGAVGIPAVHLSTWDDRRTCGPFYHSALDTIDTIAPAALEQTTQVVQSSLITLAEAAEPRRVTQQWLPLVTAP